MDTGLKAYRTMDVDLIKSVVTDPEIWKTVSEDGHDPETYEPDLLRSCWLVIEGEEIIGLFEYKAVNSICLEVHPFILPKHRGKTAYDAGKLQMKWMYDNYPEYQKFVGNIPTIYKNVKLFCNVLGYRDEGINRASFLKNGEVHDQWLIGMTRKEVESVICPA